MKVVLILLFVAYSHALMNPDWEMFKKTHAKSYTDEAEEHRRMEIYRQNKLMVAQHNDAYRKGLVSFHLKMNHFGDMTAEEVRSIMNRYNNTVTAEGTSFIGAANVQLPDSVDWRLSGAVTPVKDQARCGSCWAFSASGALEGQHFRKTGKLVSLSEQNLVDCSIAYGNNGCAGGMPSFAFRYIKDNGGIDAEDSYPYEGHGGLCRFQSSKVSATDAGYVTIPKGDEAALLQAVATVGPISVAIDAGLSTFHLYSGGVYYSKDCSSQRLDHAVLVIGYGTENGQDYWLVKNSWNTVWGEGGFIKMARNKGNNCGIATSAVYPIV